MCIRDRKRRSRIENIMNTFDHPCSLSQEDIRCNQQQDAKRTTVHSMRSREPEISSDMPEMPVRSLGHAGNPPTCAGILAQSAQDRDRSLLGTILVTRSGQTGCTATSPIPPQESDPFAMEIVFRRMGGSRTRGKPVVSL